MQTYKGIEYIVYKSSLASFCGYVRLPDNHPYQKFTGYDSMDIDCHGGLTFGERITKKTKKTFHKDLISVLG